MKKITIFVLLLILGVLFSGCEGNSAEVYVYPDENLTELEQRALEPSILQISGVESLEYVTSEEALAQFLEVPVLGSLPING